MKKLPLNVLDRLYKAEIGDTIDNTYLRLTGGWMVGELRLTEGDGLVGVTLTFQFAFKDLSDGLYYQATDIVEPVFDRSSPSMVWYKEPFTDTSRDTMPVFPSQYCTRIINMVDYLEPLQP